MTQAQLQRLTRVSTRNLGEQRQTDGDEPSVLLSKQEFTRYSRERHTGWYTREAAPHSPA